MKKKTVKIFAAILVVGLLASWTYVLIGTNHAKNLMWEYLDTNGYSKTDVQEMQVKHSFMNILLSYNEWSIQIRYTDEPGAIYSHTIKNGEIVETGVSGTVEKENLKHKK